MLKKKLFFSCLILLCFFAQSNAQKIAEGGIFLGRSYYIGELNPVTHYGNGVGNFTFGGIFRYNLNKRYSLKAMLIRTNLNGTDEDSEFPFNAVRMAEFETKLTEFSTSIEFNFLPYKMGDKKHFFSPYLFVGFSIYNFDPNSSIAGIEVVT